MIYGTIMSILYVILYIALGVLFICICRWLPGFIAGYRHRRNKELMRQAIKQEEYENALYEEVMNEEMDKLAKDANKKMFYYRSK